MKTKEEFIEKINGIQVSLASALNSNCKTIYPEDMNDGQIIESKLKIINPFKNLS